MTDEIFKLVNELNKLYEISYNNIEPLVLELISNNTKDINQIEEYLDILSNIPTDKSYKLFLLLCNYYKTTNKENANYYIKEYKKLYK